VGVFSAKETMAITEQHEAAAAQQRGRKRQNKEHPLLIRDDGVLFPNVPLVAKKANFRIYTGNPRATLEERKRYVKMGGLRQVPELVNTDVPPFDVGNASKEDIILFARDEFGFELDAEKPLARLREDLIKLAKSMGAM
jgi:hypothetical protein